MLRVSVAEKFALAVSVFLCDTNKVGSYVNTLMWLTLLTRVVTCSVSRFNVNTGN